MWQEFDEASKTGMDVPKMLNNYRFETIFLI